RFNLYCNRVLLYGHHCAGCERIGRTQHQETAHDQGCLGAGGSISGRCSGCDRDRRGRDAATGAGAELRRGRSHRARRAGGWHRRRSRLEPLLRFPRVLPLCAGILLPARSGLLPAAAELLEPVLLPLRALLAVREIVRTRSTGASVLLITG